MVRDTWGHFLQVSNNHREVCEGVSTSGAEQVKRENIMEEEGCHKHKQIF